MMSFCMIAAQGVMLPIAILVGRNADKLGRRPIFVIAFAGPADPCGALSPVG